MNVKNQPNRILNQNFELYIIEKPQLFNFYVKPRGACHQAQVFSEYVGCALLERAGPKRGTQLRQFNAEVFKR